MSPRNSGTDAKRPEGTFYLVFKQDPQASTSTTISPIWRGWAPIPEDAATRAGPAHAGTDLYVITCPDPPLPIHIEANLTATRL